MAYTDGEPIDWNANMGWLKLYIDLMGKAQAFRHLGQNYSWFCALRDAYAMIHHLVLEPGQEKVETELEDKFKVAQTFMSQSQNVNGANATAIFVLDRIAIILWDLTIAYNLVVLKTEKPDKDVAVSIGVKG